MPVNQTNPAPMISAWGEVDVSTGLAEPLEAIPHRPRRLASSRVNQTDLLQRQFRSPAVTRLAGDHHVFEIAGAAPGIRQDMIVGQPHRLQAGMLVCVPIVVSPAKSFRIRLPDQSACLTSNDRYTTEPAMESISANQLRQPCLRRHAPARALLFRNRRQANIANEWSAERPAGAPQRFGPCSDRWHVCEPD